MANTTLHPVLLTLSDLLHQNLTNTSYTQNITKTTPNCEVEHENTDEAVVNAAFLLFIMLAGTLGNLLVVLAVLLSRTLKRRVTFYFVVSLGM